MKNVKHSSSSAIKRELQTILMKNIPTHDLSEEWEDKIQNLLPKHHLKHQSILQDVLSEVRNIFQNEMRRFDLQSTLAIEGNHDEEIKIYQVHQTAENPVYIKNRKSLKKNYFLSHKLVRTVIKTYYNLPAVLIDLTTYHSSEVLTLADITKRVKQDIKRIGLRILRQFYLKIVDSMLGMNELKTMQPLRLRCLLHCATVVFSQLVVNSMMHTIKHLITTLQNPKSYPRMKLVLVYDNNCIFLKPRLTEIFAFYHSIVDDISTIAQDLVPLEYWMKLEMEGYIKIQPPRWFLNNCHRKLQQVLETSFQSLKDHREDVNAQFGGIEAATVSNLPDDFCRLQQDEFYVLCEHVETLNEYHCQAKSLIDIVYFEVSLLDQSEASASLQNHLSNKIDSLLRALVFYHKSIVMEIQVEFEAIESRALDIPDETKPLFELCEYLWYASKVKVKELEERIRISIRMLSSLLQVTAITEDHMGLNVAIINKLTTMDQIFLQSNNLCENMKSVLEDELQRKMNVLNQKIDRVIPELVILDDMDDISRAAEYIEFLVILVKKIGQLEGEIEEMNLEERLFKFPETAFPKVVEIREILGPFDTLVRLVCNWQRDHSIWMNGPFENLKADEIERKTHNYSDELSQINATFKMKIKTEMVLSKAFKFSGIVDDSDPMQHPAPLKLCWQALRDIGNFQKNVPLAICMCNKSLRRRHWDEMSLLAGFDLTPNARTTLATMVELNLFDELHNYEVISISASKELELESRLVAMTKEWDKISFNIDSTFAFRSHHEIDSLLENHSTEIETMRCSNFVYHVGDEVETFCGSLNNLRRCLNQLPVVHDRFQQLKRLFSNKKITPELENCTELFGFVVTGLGTVEDLIRSDPTFNRFRNNDLLSTIEKTSCLLNELQNFVRNFFDSLRLKFYRFFFMTDEDLVTVLNPTTDIEFQASFQKCFAELNAEFEGPNIVSAFDGMGDKITFGTAVETSTATSPIQWLTSFEHELFKSLVKSSSNSVKLFSNQTIDPSFDLLTWIETTLAMTILSTWKIIWTGELNCTISSEPDIKELKQRKVELKNVLINCTKTRLKNRTRLILTTLIMNLIYEENILTSLSDGAADFIWQAQLKYHFHNDEITISTIKMSIDYGFEFYSIKKPGLVMTPLTERCFHGLLIAYKNQLAGSVVGPAGVGKLETLTSLARAIAVLFYIFDCRTISSIDFMRQILQGLTCSGSWLCLNKLSHLKLEEMAPIISQTLLKSTTKMDETKLINFDGRVVKLNKFGFLCATMCPKGAEKLRALDELRRHFRTVSMMRPTVETICEIYLTAVGFAGTKSLTTKLVTLLENFQSQPSTRFSHKFNLNTVMKIIEVASCKKLSQPDLDEHPLILSAVTSVCTPKLTGNEMIIFQSLVEDSFFELDTEHSTGSVLLESIEKLCDEKSYFLTEPFKFKLVQLFETMQLGRDLIIVGEPLTGKTTSLQKLSELLSVPETRTKLNLQANIKLRPMNQNAIDKAKFCDFLVGSEWIELTQPEEAGTWNWIVFDGNLSDNFHELVQVSLNSGSTDVFGTGDKLKSNLLIFETSSLNCASPSFISKCSIIHLEKLDRSSIINWEIKTRFPNHEGLISVLFNWSTQSCLTFLNDNCSSIILTTNDHLMICTWNLFQIFLHQAFSNNENEKEIKKDQVISWCQAALVLATAHGLGGFLKESSQPLFDSFCISLWTGRVAKFPYPAQIKPFENLTLNSDQLREYFYVFKGNGSWKYCGDALKGESIVEHSLTFKDPFVPTTDSTRLTTILQSHLKNNQPFILCSDVPSGKSSFLKYFFENKLGDMDWKLNLYQLTSKLSAEAAQKFILSKMVKMNFNRYQGKDLVNLIDDLHLTFGDEPIPLLELIRQHLDHEHWFDLEQFRPIYLSGASFCAALTNPGTKICRRFLRHFHVYALHPPSRDNMFRIFSNVLLLHLKTNLFATDVLPSVNNIVNASLTVYEDVLGRLKPVPDKFHYRFDLRDVSRIIKGCGLVQKDSVESKVTFARLWVHETCRVLGDKITDDGDERWLFLRLKQLVKSQFKESFESAFDHLPKDNENEITKESLNQLLFGNFVDDGRKYEEVPNMSVARNKVSQLLEEYNSSHDEKLDLTLTSHFLIQVVKVCRILTVPGENLVWVSSHGSGRRSISQLAAYMARQKFVEMSVSSGWHLEDWKKDLRDALVTCGSTDKSIAFLVKDSQLKEDHLRDISGLVKSGQIPDLFSRLEWQSIVRSVRLSAQNGDRNLELPIDLVKEYFTAQCKRKLHFVVCLNHHDRGHLKRFYENYSSLTSCCQVGWWKPWPEEALQQVASNLIKDMKLNDETKRLSLKACSHFYNYMQTQVRNLNYLPNSYVPVPTHYFTMTKLFVSIYQERLQTTTETRNNYRTGLKKLDQTARHVKEMKVKLNELQQLLVVSSDETEAFMREIEQDNASIERTTVLVKADEEVANKKATIAAILKTECEADLAVAIPILEDAIAALNTLKPTDITLVKAMKNPPDTIKLVMAAVCVMLEIPADRTVDPASGKKLMDYWGPSKRVLGDMNFLQILKDYDKDNISAAVMQNIQQVYMTDPSFQPKIVAKASSAAEGLCKWVRAMVSYDKVAKVVAPKKEKLAIANNECELAQSYLEEKRKMLEQLNSKLSVMKNTLKIALGKKEQLENEVVNCSDQLDKAEQLVSSLVNEKERWIQTGEQLQELLDNMVANMVLVSAMVTYLGPLKCDQRKQVVATWKEFVEGLGLSSSCDVVRMMGLGTKIDEWRCEGLPGVSFFMEDALVIEKSLGWAYFVIDPEQIANEWIINREAKNRGFRVIKIIRADFLNLVQVSMTAGVPVVIQDVGVEEMEQILCLVSRSVYRDEGKMFVQFGSYSVEVELNFKLYVISNVRSAPEDIRLYNKFTVVDFSLTSEAREIQLLDIVTARERPVLFERFKDMEARHVRNKRVIENEERRILELLSTTEDIITDGSAVNRLVKSKSLFLTTLEHQVNFERIKTEVETIVEEYKPFASFATRFYNIISSLSSLNHAYRFSISSFVSLYKRSLETSNRSRSFNKLLEYFKLSILKNIYSSVRRSLLQVDTLVFSFLTAVNVQLDSNLVTADEFKMFMTINSEHLAAERANPGEPWLPENSWQKLSSISSRDDELQKFVRNFETDPSTWKSFYQSPEDYNLPDYYQRLSTFRKLTILRILRPDKVVSLVRKFVTEVVQNVIHLDLTATVSKSFLESSCLNPILFILPNFSSPLKAVGNHAKLIGCSSEMENIYLGQNQDLNIETKLEEARQKGHWIFLHNCQLASRLMLKTIDQNCDRFDAPDTNLEFRLWLSSTGDKLPVNLVLRSTKIGNDEPSDLQEILARSYTEELNDGDPRFIRLLGELFLVHATLCRRIKTQNWNLCYDFDDSDLDTSIGWLKSDEMSLDLIRYVVGKCIYGGRILDDSDMGILGPALERFFDFQSDVVNRIRRVLESARITDHKSWIQLVDEKLNDEDCSKFFESDGIGEIRRNEKELQGFERKLLKIEVDFLVSENDVGLGKENFVRCVIQFVRDNLGQHFCEDEVQEKYPFDRQEPLNHLLQVEVQNWNNILKIVRSSLEDLEKFYNGGMDRISRFEDLETNLYRNEVPPNWKINSPMRFTERSLTDFVVELKERLIFIKHWIDSGHPRNFLLKVLTVPSAFIVAVKLKFCRRRHLLFDQVSMDFRVVGKEHKVDEDEILLSELYLSGAQWDKNNWRLCKNVTTNCYHKMPKICLQLKVKNFEQNEEPLKKIRCPLYVSSKARNKKYSDLDDFSNFVLNVELESDVELGAWERTETALYCDIE